VSRYRPWYILNVVPSAAGENAGGQNVSPLLTVCADPDVAAALISQGASVVLYGADAERLGEAITVLRPGPGRVAVLIGDPADPDVEGAAGAMAAELFGGAPVVVPVVTRPSAEARIRYR
jgi:hypothetical protein